MSAILISENKYFSTFEEYYVALEEFGERFKVDMGEFMEKWDGIDWEKQELDYGMERIDQNVGVSKICLKDLFVDVNKVRLNDIVSFL